MLNTEWDHHKREAYIINTTLLTVQWTGSFIVVGVYTSYHVVFSNFIWTLFVYKSMFLITSSFVPNLNLSYIVSFRIICFLLRFLFFYYLFLGSFSIFVLKCGVKYDNRNKKRSTLAWCVSQPECRVARTVGNPGTLWTPTMANDRPGDFWLFFFQVNQSTL